MWFNLFIFAFIICVFDVVPKEIIAKIVFIESLCFSSKLILSSLMLKSLFQFELSWCKIRIKFHSFVCEYSLLVGM
jgi:hypothetical protein